MAPLIDVPHLWYSVVRVCVRGFECTMTILGPLLIVFATGTLPGRRCRRARRAVCSTHVCSCMLDAVSAPLTVVGGALLVGNMLRCRRLADHCRVPVCRLYAPALFSVVAFTYFAYIMPALTQTFSLMVRAGGDRGAFPASRLDPRPSACRVLPLTPVAAARSHYRCPARDSGGAAPSSVCGCCSTFCSTTSAAS